MTIRCGPVIIRMMILLLIVANLFACSSVTIRPQGGKKDQSDPHYLDSKAFYFGGVKGQHEVDVNEICDGAEVSQMQTVTTVSDYLIGAVTLFIYAPRTVKVWCEV